MKCENGCCGMATWGLQCSILIIFMFQPCLLVLHGRRCHSLHFWSQELMSITQRIISLQRPLGLSLQHPFFLVNLMFQIFSTSDSHQMWLCYQKLKDLEICGSGPVPSRERTPMWSVLVNQINRNEGSGVPSIEGSGGPLNWADLHVICLSQSQWVPSCEQTPGPLMGGTLDPSQGVPSFQSHVICLSQSEGPLPWGVPGVPSQERTPTSLISHTQR